MSIRRPVPLAVTLSLAALAVGCGPGRLIVDGTETGTSSGSTTEGGGGTTGMPTTGGSGSGTTAMASGMSSSSGITDPSTTTVGETTWVPGGMCDPQAQDCPPGEKCIAYASPENGAMFWDANRCAPEPPNPAQVGEPCEIDAGEDVFSGLDNCARGTMCAHFDLMTGKGGRCVAFCGVGGSCGVDEICLGDGGSSVLPLCYATCDPIAQDCEDMQGCYGDVSLTGFICAPAEVEPGMGIDGSPCQFTNACVPGLHCYDGAFLEGCADDWCCTPFCSISGGDAGCAASEDCVPFYQGNPPAGLEDVGICAIPG